MAVIDIGSAAIDRATNTSSNRTYINKGITATASGTITSIEVWAEESMTNAEVATFYRPDSSGFPDNFTTRDYETIGNVTAGSKQTFEVNLDVIEGDFIGIGFPSGTIEYDVVGGAGTWVYASGSGGIPCDNKTYNFSADRAISLYGTGVTEEEEEEANAIFFGANF